MSKLQGLAGWQQTIVVVAVFLVLCLLLGLIAEGGVRVRHYLKNGDIWGVEDTFMIDAAGLRVLIPSIERGNIRINSLGFRSPELAVPKPPGTVRLAFLGGSTTYSPEVSSNEAAWPNLVTESLQNRFPAVHFDYINAGVPGYSSETSLKNLQGRVRQYEPDVIVIYHATNDLSFHGWNLAEEQGIAVRGLNPALSWLSRYSLLWYLVEKNIFIKTQQAKSYGSEEKLNVDIDRLVAPFETDLINLGKAAKEVAAIVAIATFSQQLREEQTEEQQVKAAITHVLYMPYLPVPSVIEAFAAYNEAIRRAAKELDLLLVGGEDDIPGDSVHFVDSVHLTDAGSEAMAKRVTQSLLASNSFVQFLQSRQGNQ